MNQLAECCLPSKASWNALELFKQLDELTGMDVFVPLYAQYADTPGMPATAALFEELGVVGQGSDVRLDDQAPAAHIRQAITARR